MRTPNPQTNPRSNFLVACFALLVAMAVALVVIALPTPPLQTAASPFTPTPTLTWYPTYTTMVKVDSSGNPVIVIIATSVPSTPRPTSTPAPQDTPWPACEGRTEKGLCAFATSTHVIVTASPWPTCNQVTPIPGLRCWLDAPLTPTVNAGWDR